MFTKNFSKLFAVLLISSIFVFGCKKDNTSESGEDGKKPITSEKLVFILNEGNYNAGNSSLSHYNPASKIVENNSFQKINERKLGDMSQSMCIQGNEGYIVVGNSGIIWKVDINSLKVKGQLVSSSENKIKNPRYIHFVSKDKAYVTDIQSPYINVFNPETMQFIKSIETGESADAFGFASTEEMAQYKNFVFVTCWSSNNKILIIDTDKDEVVENITVPCLQPKSIKLDKNNKLWVLADGGYEKNDLGDGSPMLFKIDAETRKIEMEKHLEMDMTSVKLVMNKNRDELYIMNNNIYKMSINDSEFPQNPFIKADLENTGKNNTIYGFDIDPVTSEIYVADAVDYTQQGQVYRFSTKGELVDKFTVGINPNSFYFKEASK